SSSIRSTRRSPRRAASRSRDPVQAARGSASAPDGRERASAFATPQGGRGVREAPCKIRLQTLFANGRLRHSTMASGAGSGERAPLKPARPIGLQVKHLEALMAIAVEGSFGGAARRLGYTQSAVSQQIAALERLVGQRLVDRSKSAEPPRLTPAGRLLLEYAQTLMSVVYAAAAVPADSDLGRRGGPVSLRDLGSLPMITGSDARLPDDGTTNGRAAFREVDSRTLLAFVRAGLGAALVPELAVESDDRSVVALPLADPIAPQQVVLVTHASRRPQLPLDWLQDLGRSIGRDLVHSRNRSTTPRVRHRRGQ